MGSGVTTTVTKRLSEAAAEGSTKRVPSFMGSSYRAWGASWGTPAGDAWGVSWRILFGASEIGLTLRVTEAPATGITKRVTI